ncbi:hypothetical protein [Pedobacter sp.]|uniref:hypothetical protein n=1 Tax=Pedobacter sp. TaxID=1411316 RepID=UPI0031D9C6D9
MNTKAIKFIFATIIPFFMVQHAIASGFPMRKGKALLAPYLSYFVANQYRDLNGQKYSYANDGKYSSFTTQLYLEYGITDHLDLVAKLPLTSAQFKDNIQRNRNTALSDVEIGLKYNLLEFNQKKYFLSAQALAAIPLYSKNGNPSTGYGQFGSELKLLFSGSTAAAYFNVEAGYRQYFGNTFGNVGQLSYIATSGLHLGKNNQLMGEINGISSLRSNQFNPENPASNTEFTFIKANISFGQRITGENWIFAGLFHDIFNRNSGIGQGLTVTGIIRF